MADVVCNLVDYLADYTISPKDPCVLDEYFDNLQDFSHKNRVTTLFYDRLRENISYLDENKYQSDCL